jgi:methylase of polypeptide subunit release factors
MLVSVTFTGEKIGEALGTGDEIVSRSTGIPVQVRQLAQHGTFGALVRLLILDLDVPIAELAPAIAPLTIDELVRLRIIEQRGEAARPLVRIVPHDHLLITSDVRLRAGEAAPADHVPGVHRPSVTLAHLTVRRQVRSFLDLGSGCGVEAMLASPHAERVLATDVSPRAVNFAAFNAQLNLTSNIEHRAGSWFEPVGDERFETIVCNPPYVISPASEFIYRDSGLKGDSVSEQVVRSIPAHLAEGGFGTVQISWVADPDGDAAEPVRRWVHGSGCDAWLLHYRTDQPLETAAVWNQMLE